LEEGVGMSLIEKIPGMTDEDVVSFLANARRLSETGTDKQKVAASELLPALEAAAGQRQAAKLEAATAKRIATPRKPRKVAVEKEPAEDAVE
jgi:hypothetical protein